MTTIPAIDADGHILERQDEISKYLDKRWSGRDRRTGRSCSAWGTPRATGVT